MRYTLSVLVMLISFNVVAQVTITDFDLNPGMLPSAPSNFISFKSKLYFTASNGTNGGELWMTDGTSTPTMIYDINPGPAVGMGGDNPMCELGGKLYMAADNGTKGMELFVFDGTSAPTLALDVDTGMSASFPRDLVAANGKLYFSASTVANGRELWVYDPTTGKGNRLTDISTGSITSEVAYLTLFKGKIYFRATGVATGVEVHYVDLANNSIGMLPEFVPGSGFSNPSNFIVLGSKLYFSAVTTAQGCEIYSYEGTGSPKRLPEVAGGKNNTIKAESKGIFAHYGKLYFHSGTDNFSVFLYVLDPATDIATRIPGVNEERARCFVSYGFRLFYTAFGTGVGDEMYAFDGTNSVLIKDMNPGVASGEIGASYIVFNNELYFSANNKTQGLELHKLSDALTNVKHVSMNTPVVISPNPCKNDVNIQLDLTTPANFDISISDITGKLLYSTGAKEYSGNARVNIPMQELGSGNYIVTVKEHNGTATNYNLVKE